VPVRSIPVGEIRQLGEHALLLGVESPVAARRLVRAIHASGLDGLVEVVGGTATVMVAFEPDHEPDHEEVEANRSTLAELMDAARRQPVDEVGAANLLEIPCSFDGPDLADVAAAARGPTESVIDMITAATFTVDVVGFSPGFAYLAGLPEELRHIARRPQPRPVVPAGSVALANGYAAVYPTASPGGWQLVGRTDVPLFTPLEPPYAQLAPGDRVRFTRSEAPVREGGPPPTPSQSPPGVVNRPRGARPAFVVEAAGLRTAWQDGGRRGLAALGVPSAGPADPHSFRLANALVGNPREACALEVTARGPTLRCLSATFVSVVGGSADIWVEGQPVRADRVVPVGAGQQLVVGPVHGGLRAYIAVAGGFVGSPVLGSCASDQLSGLGPGPIARGDELWVAALEPPLGDHLQAGTSTAVEEGAPTVLRVVPGPHPERFAPGTLASLPAMQFTVGIESNRVGLRLRPDPSTPSLARAVGPWVELDSQGMVTGAVQVPPGGEPVVLLTDHATLGGYPVVAVVAAVDHGRLGQCAPGSRVVLAPIDHEQAAEAWREHRRLMATAVVGRYPLAVE
jgi:KipI family sensor histidine kinase inhibitor